MKRTVDIVLATTGLIVLLPVMLLVAGAVLVTMGRPVLFGQLRPGRHAVLFRMYKFRTMREPPAGAAPDPDTDAQRLTPFGRWLRATSLDELPELWNVLRGDMSLVGPRPLLPEYLPLYTPQQARRHEVRPGITGLAQVSGRNAIDWPSRLALDVWYVDHQSLLLDARILASTVVRVLRRQGVSQPGRDTMERFTGEHA